MPVSTDHIRPIVHSESVAPPVQRLASEPLAPQLLDPQVHSTLCALSAGGGEPAGKTGSLGPCLPKSDSGPDRIDRSRPCLFHFS